MQFDPNMLGQMTPTQYAAFVGQQVQQNYSEYQFFTSNLTFSQLKQSLGQLRKQRTRFLGRMSTTWYLFGETGSSEMRVVIVRESSAKRPIRPPVEIRSDKSPSWKLNRRSASRT